MISKEIYTQVLVIGSGPAGYTAAFRCADLGLKTILIEKHNCLGGVCLNVGCVPSKYLLHISQVINDAKNLSLKGIDFGVPKLDLSKIIIEKNKIIENLSNSLNIMSKNKNIKVMHGFGVFNGKNSVLFSNNDTKNVIYFENVIIATGSKSIKLSQFPENDDHIWDSTKALELSVIPNRLLIVGAGVIGLEMATFYSTLGSDIDVMDTCNQLLPMIDRDIVKIFEKSIYKRFNLKLDRKIVSVKKIKDSISISSIDSYEKQYISNYDAILVAAGRIPNLHDLCIEKLGVKLNKNGFIKVDNQLKTNISNVYAIGDVTGRPMLAHKGIYQAYIAAEVISGKNYYFDPKVIPSIAYTYPEIAWVGICELEAKDLGISYHIIKFPWKSLGKSVVSNCSNGMTKLIFNKETNRIIGGCIIGNHSGELLGEIALAIEMGCDAEDIALTIHAHPTLYESIGLSAKIFSDTVTNEINKI